MITDKKLVAVAGVALGVGLASAQPMKAPPPPPVDNVAIAEKVVATSAGVKEGDVVQIMGGPQDLALLEEIVVAVRKRGAHPLLTLNSESIAKKMVASVPDKFDAQSPKLALELTKFVNVRIVIPAVRDPNIFTALPPERRAKIAKAEAPAEEQARRKNIRFVELGNGFAPSASRAKELGMSELELTKMFWASMSADFTAVQGKCDALKTTLAAGKELKITHANGTDITIKLKSKKVITSDGIITDADIKAGGPGVQVWLPAGEAYLVPGVSNGKVVDDKLVFEGKTVESVTVEVKNGKSTAITAKSGWDTVKARYDLAGPGKAELSIVDFGCNPAISGKLESFVGAGVVTLFFGGNVWAGGTNKEPFGIPLHLTGTNVTVDGKPLIENGMMK